MTTIRDYIRDVIADAIKLEDEFCKETIDKQDMEYKKQDLEDLYTEKIHALLERVTDL